MRLVWREFQALDRAEDDVLVLELRLAGLQPLAALEGDLDGRPLLRQRVPAEPRADRDGDERDDPNCGQAPRTACRGVRNDPRLGDICHGQSPFTSCLLALSSPVFCVGRVIHPQNRKVPARIGPFMWTLKPKLLSLA